MEPSEVWEKYWLSQNLKDDFNTDLKSYQISSFHLLKQLIKKNNIKSILSAGSGQDLICFKLQKFFDNGLDIILLDTSMEVLDWNKRIFENNGLKVSTIKSDIFDIPANDSSFDLVFNTGVMEHFLENDQVTMTKEIMRVLKPGCFFVAANPSINAKIYKLGMEIAQKKGTWPFGRETPVKTLMFLKDKISDIDSIEEVDRDFLSQLNFLPFINPFLNIFGMPFKILGKKYAVSRIYDMLLGRILGTYLIISIIKKK